MGKDFTYLDKLAKEKLDSVELKSELSWADFNRNRLEPAKRHVFRRKLFVYAGAIVALISMAGLYFAVPHTSKPKAFRINPDNSTEFSSKKTDNLDMNDSESYSLSETKTETNSESGAVIVRKKVYVRRTIVVQDTVYRIDTVNIQSPGTENHTPAPKP